MFVTKPLNLQSQKSYKSIYSKPMNLNTKNVQQPLKRRKKGRGFQSQHQVQHVDRQANGNLLIGPSNGSTSSVKRKSSSSRFSPDALAMPIVKRGTNHGFRLPRNTSQGRINENNFKNHIVKEPKHSEQNLPPKGRFSSHERKTTLSSMKIRSMRGTTGSIAAGIPISSNTNHHYGYMFNTNHATKQSSDFSSTDKRRAKNMKHMKRMTKDKQPKLETMGRYYLPLTERNSKKRPVL